MLSTIVKNNDMVHSYTQYPSIANCLPWQDYNDKYKLFLLEDNISLAAGFEFTPIPCEARPERMMEEISNALSEALKNAIPSEKNNPWILQLFVERSSDLSLNYQNIENYFRASTRDAPTSFTKAHLKTLKKHFEYVSRKEGIYFDRQVTNQIFKGGFLHVRGMLYRRVTEKKEQNTRRNAVEEIVRVSRKLSDQLRACGLKVKRMKGDEFYYWMSDWFNPQSKPKDLSYPTPEQKPFGWNLTENIFFIAV